MLLFPDTLLFCRSNWDKIFFIILRPDKISISLYFVSSWGFLFCFCFFAAISFPVSIWCRAWEKRGLVERLPGGFRERLRQEPDPRKCRGALRRPLGSTGSWSCLRGSLLKGHPPSPAWRGLPACGGSQVSPILMHFTCSPSKSQS